MNIAVLTLFIVICCLVTALVSILWCRKRLQHHLAWANKAWEPNGIELLESVDIGGTKQWIHVRGRNRENPLLLFIHGGPGAANIGYFDQYQRSWENHFTVVQWDQRQTGKSYAPNIGHTISHETYINDAEAMIAYLLQRFNKEKLFLIATSYGTYLSMHMVKKHPEWIYAYLAAGQVVKMVDHVVEEYRLLLEYAKDNEEIELTKKLESLKPFPNPDDPASSFLESSAFFLSEETRLGKCFPDNFEKAVEHYNFSRWVSPLCTLRDNYNRVWGEAPAMGDKNNPFRKGFYTFDLPTEIGSRFDVPIFFITGTDDFHISFSVTDKWFQGIEAPHKEHIVFKASAHAAHITEPYLFAKVLIEKVLPYADSRKVFDKTQ